MMLSDPVSLRSSKARLPERVPVTKAARDAAADQARVPVQSIFFAKRILRSGRTRGSSPIGAEIRCDVSRMRRSASDSEAVHRWSGTVAKAVCVTVHASRVYPTCAYLSADLG